MKINWRAVFKFFRGIFKSKSTKMNEKFDKLIYLKNQVFRELEKLQNLVTEEFVIDERYRTSIIFDCYGHKFYRLSFKINLANNSISFITTLLEIKGRIGELGKSILNVSPIEHDLRIDFTVFPDGIIILSGSQHQSIEEAVFDYYELIKSHVEKG